MTIDQKINEWTEERDKLQLEYTQITRKPYLEALKQEGLVGTTCSILTLQYLTHPRNFLDLDMTSLYIASGSILLGLLMFFLGGDARGYSLGDTERREGLRDDINHHNEVLRSMRTAPERYDPEVWYKIQVERLGK